MPLKKSFSEPNGPPGRLQTRQHWNKARSHSAVNHSTTTRNPIPKTLQPISEVSKNKLNAFKCQDTTKSNDHDTTTSDLPIINIDAPPSDAAPSRDGLRGKRNRKQDLETTPSLPASKDSLTTPMSRLAWQDLIGTIESKEVEEDTSPNERISWDIRDDPQQRLKLSPVMPGKRGKKRARSSSPVSSPASHSKPHTPSVNIGKLSRALKSPHADPALELWDRFSLNGSKSITPLGAMNSALAQIMVSSSPRPSRIESSLRRSISCGENWPKRRKVERADVAEPMEIAAEESPSGHSKLSMLNALLKKGTREIDRSKVVQARQDALRSPSPKKNSSQPISEANGSPTRRISSKLPTPSLVKENAPAAMKSSLDTLIDELSDYGDDDFDEDTLMELDASLGQPKEENAEDDLIILPADTGQNLERQQPNQETLYDDEFADMDDDVFTAAEDLITQIDSSRSSKGKPETPCQPAVAAQEKQTTIVDDLGGDVFEDDFGGDFDFDAAEIAATQSASSKQVNGSLPPVRRW
ncbi:uncharacterized protein GGS22DRAFT_93105 [Annulohypoxylon maeteangense]|uniref:uncharacterized protein n=1 Tax=Annulohypoxylon maeteangense TaxID=1927788 RepID=UPI0020075302|nr:uncharacterized protein GGS22DRAFT_93105 [Annulohypoxylon maeteangense]KAI0888076.1 hypothetical protein GGS22DRAFT_93105 [Annulohypoxylon maeteangense]